MPPDTTPAAVRAALAGDLAELQRGLETLTEQVEQINVALTGNGLGVSHGLIGCVQRLDQQQSNQAAQITCIENRWQKIKWAIVGIALGSGLGGAGLATALLKAVS
jgi:hypothetical protein